MRVILFYRGLTIGGTERQIVALAAGLAKRGHAVTVLTFYDDNPLGAGLAEAGVELVSLGKKGRWEIFGFLIRFLTEIRRRRPQILYSFLPMSNLIALAARLVAPGLPIVWGVRTAFLVLDHHDRLTRLSYWAEGSAAGMARLVITNSYSGLEYLKHRGFPEKRLLVVSNGVDTDRFQPNSEARLRVRAEWGLDSDTPTIGMVARLDPEKGIPLFLEAAAILAPGHSGTRLAVIGGGDPDYRTTLVAMAERLGIGHQVLWIGPRADMPDVYNALDLLVLSSPNEGTSNVILEAMACGVSVVATDVGDNRRSIGTMGRVSFPGDPASLANAIWSQLDRRVAEGSKLGEGCRQHIIKYYSLDAMVESTEALLQSSIGRR